MGLKQEVMQGRTVILTCWFFLIRIDEENEVRWPLYELEIKTGVSINPYIIPRKSWENRPFKTPFYVNVVNEGVIL